MLTGSAGVVGPRLTGYDLVGQRGRGLAGQGGEKGNEIATLGVRQLEPARKIPGERGTLDDAAFVVAQHVRQRRQRAVVHVGRRAADLAQPGRLEGVLSNLEPQHRTAAAVVAR